MAQTVLLRPASRASDFAFLENNHALPIRFSYLAKQR